MSLLITAGMIVLGTTAFVVFTRTLKVLVMGINKGFDVLERQMDRKGK